MAKHLLFTARLPPACCNLRLHRGSLCRPAGPDHVPSTPRAHRARHDRPCRRAPSCCCPRHPSGDARARKYRSPLGRSSTSRPRSATGTVSTSACAASPTTRAQPVATSATCHTHAAGRGVHRRLSRRRHRQPAPRRASRACSRTLHGRADVTRSAGCSLAQQRRVTPRHAGAGGSSRTARVFRTDLRRPQHARRRQRVEEHDLSARLARQPRNNDARDRTRPRNSRAAAAIIPPACAGSRL